MVHRLVNPPKSNSFFLFGPRGSGKSTFLKTELATQNTFYIDLLEDSTESRYRRHPDLLLSDVLSSKKKYDWVIIDEVQKIPKLLDLVHKMIEEHKIRFALTGSSARKLKRGGANLLAGRAFLFNLFPFTLFELKNQFDLEQALQWGTLPKIYSYSSSADKKDFLISYVRSYLKEEILLEQLVRNIDGFRDFLEIAAQMNGKILNFSKISRETGLDPKTIKEYFQILEDTLLGFWLPGFHQSVRKSQTFQPKFYFFDVGVCRAIEGSLDSVPVLGTSAYGQWFESFLMTEIFRLNHYSKKDFRLSHYQTSSGSEIDLVLSKGLKKIVVEIKSTKSIDAQEVKKFARLASAFKNAKYYFVSQDKITSEIEGVLCLHYKKFLSEIFEIE